MAQDYYSVLGVKRDASQADIAKAYRDLARKYHPDLHPDDKSAKKKFQDVQSAFDVLNDPKKREMYDRYGSAFEQMGQGGGGPQPGGQWNYGGGGPGAEDIDFSQIFGERFARGGGGGGRGGGSFADIFEQFTRGGRGQQQAPPPQTGQDLEHEAQVSFATAVLGGEVQLSLQGEGGKQEVLSVKIPAGIESGKRIRLRGKGHPGPAGPGDLYLRVQVAPHPMFRRSGNNLIVTLPVTLGEAAAGAKVDVPSPKGTVSLTVPPGTSSGAKLRIRGHGVEPKGKPAGDLLAEIKIVLPKDLSEEEQTTLRELSERHPLNPRSDLKW